MKEEFQKMVPILEQGLKEKTRGFAYFSHQMYQTMLSCYSEDTKTVYVSGYAFPTELLWAFDVTPFDFEVACNNMPTVVNGNGSSIMHFSEDRGFGRDICSFDRLIIACMHENMLPKGDLFLTSSYYCQGKSKTNEVVARSFGKESVVLDVPNEISDASIRYVSDQLKQIALMLEEITGDILYMDRLRESIHSSNRARAKVAELNELMKTKPCPWNGFEACLFGLGGAVFSGSPVREKASQVFLDEIRERIEKRKLRPEKLRILWFPWVPVQTTNIFNTLRYHKVSVVMAEAGMAWWPELDAEKPFESLALKALRDPHIGSCDRRAENLTRWAEEYDVDGAIHFSTPSCYHETGSVKITSDRLKEKGIPLLDLAGDMSDERAYSPEQTLNKITTFLEMIS